MSRITVIYEKQFEFNATVAHKDQTLPRFQNTSQNPKTLPRIDKHFSESKTLPRIQNHIPESKKISQNPKQAPESKTHPRFWILESVFEFWDVFWIMGSVFEFWNVFQILGNVFGFWEVFRNLALKGCLLPPSSLEMTRGCSLAIIGKCQGKKVKRENILQNCHRRMNKSINK